VPHETAGSGKLLAEHRRVVKRRGCLFSTGIDLAVRAKVASDLRWRPVRADRGNSRGGHQYERDWPCAWMGVEPLKTKREDWPMWHAAVFRL